MQRPILKVLDKGVERFLADMPYQAGDHLHDLRRWTEIWTRDASRFQINKAKQNALARGGRHA